MSGYSAEKAVEARVVMLAGDEEALRRRALHELLEIATADGDFDLQTFEGDAASPAEWIASAGTAPFLSAKRTVIVRHLLRRDDPPSSAQLASLPPTALLVLVADEEQSADEQKARRLQTIQRAWEKVVGAAGGTVGAFKTDPKQVKVAIRAEATRLGKKLSDAGAERLAEMTGGSLSRSFEELEKLAIYLSDGDQITEADIRAVVVPSREWNVFRLIDATVDGSPGEALRQLRILVGAQTRAEGAALSRILPMLSRQLRLMWQARVCVEAGCAPGSPTPEARGCFPEKPNLAGEPPYRQSRLMQVAKRTSLSALARCLQSVSDADAKLKGQLPGFSAMETLESMVLEMVEILAPTAIR